MNICGNKNKQEESLEPLITWVFLHCQLSSTPEAPLAYPSHDLTHLTVENGSQMSINTNRHFYTEKGGGNNHPDWNFAA